MIWGFHWSELWYPRYWTIETFVYHDEHGPIKCYFIGPLHVCRRQK
jgi:hypothetical protein